jgi:hypothetical protein
MRRFEHYTEEELNARERRSMAAIEGEHQNLVQIAVEREIRRSGRMESELAVPQGAASDQ